MMAATALSGGTRTTSAITAELPTVAVTRAISAAFTWEADRLKAALVAPTGTVTPAGTIASGLPLETVNVAGPAAAKSVTVQLVVPGAVTLRGLQVRLLNCTVRIVSTAPAATTGIGSASGDTPTASLIRMADAESMALLAT